MYKVLAEAPDPYPLLENCCRASHLSSSPLPISDVRRTKESNQQNALDASKRRVEQLEARMNELVARKESEISVAYDEHMRDHEERSLTTRLSELECEYTRHEGVVEVARGAATRSEERISDKMGAREADSARAEADALKTKLKTLARTRDSEGLDLDDDWSSPDEGEDGSLEVLLATKNERILEELTRFRILHTSLEASLKSTQDELADTRRTCQATSHIKLQQLKKTLDTQGIEIIDNQKESVGLHDTINFLGTPRALEDAETCLPTHCAFLSVLDIYVDEFNSRATFDLTLI
ncbi:hypothetical protein BDR07DRAFT_1493969 [Suillus spraguei]|nr:hypothetical protein BDR07DRAFT_1493969 [Suillus spraguei]